MEFYAPRKLKFKAWNQETKLLMRLNAIDCVKGELVKRNHILLQFTGMCDNQEEELYELDVVLLESEKFVIVWNSEHAGWFLKKLSNAGWGDRLVGENSQKAVRLWNYFESGTKV
jgi:hypothetical protein